MTRIVHVTTGLGLGGAETALFRLLSVLQPEKRTDHAVISLTPGCRFDFAGIGVPVRVADVKALGLGRGFCALRRALCEERPDAIHAWMMHACIAAALAAPRGVPVIWGLRHALKGLGAEKRAFRMLVGTGVAIGRLPRVRRIVFVSATGREQHLRIGYPAAKCLTIPNGFDLDAFRPDEGRRAAMRSSLGVEPDALLVGSFGRVHPAKNHPLLLRGFATAARDFPRARLVLAGSGTEGGDADFDRLVEQSGLGDRILRLGPRADMAALYDALDLYAQSSGTEAFPNVLGEASAAGVPCVATDVGDSALILGGTGRLVTSGDEAAFAAALGDLMALSPAERAAEGARARAHVAARFGRDAVADAWRALYAELAS